MSFYTEQEISTIVNNSVKTELCDIMKKHNSVKDIVHCNYTKLYSALFTGKKNRPINILEIGTGYPENKGSRHRGWKEYFPKAKIYGCGEDKKLIKFSDPHIKGFYLNPSSPSNIVNTFYVGRFRDVDFDIIIDSGNYQYPVNAELMSLLLPKLRENGFYIIENIQEYIYIQVPESYYRKQYFSLTELNGVNSNVLVLQNKIMF